MLVLLPPSETKSDGGNGAPLDLGELSMPQLTDTREMLVQALVDLAADSEASMRALGLGATQADEIERNAKLWVSATRPALERYTGVLFDALDASSFTRVQREKAYRRLAMGSALFGAVRAGDPIPAYRLSGGSKLPGFGTLQALWKPELTDALVAEAAGDLVVDLRSGVYQQLGPVPGAVTATVLTEQPDGTRKVVSHFNKHHKGLLARALVLTRAEPSDVRSVARVAAKAGLRVEVASPTELIVLT
ncbi:peroxide stress protein YaaA [Rhodococcus sp. HM1]|uniref:peroxide stress protein YaaA n=1 Tax=unclassified Rhodococcus (in: high G+C Gram-positive bacteria) TaxID=192944 RepID=UPI0018CE4723|nr:MULTISPECIES: peroxide stress protein YaaA [unclassified Rhodococcus (in: high G+C Gram-positive bacteria)]MBH0122414.1 peroxide stress protein YaaA [Rhodococcus sp. CX]MCK8670496.1 peroxide stress protein YaaA [Rhodococcus sp. HM1]